MPATPRPHRLRPDRPRRLAGRWKPSILLGKALAAGILNPAAEPVSLVRGERADLRRIKYAVSSPILLAELGPDSLPARHISTVPHGTPNGPPPRSSVPTPEPPSSRSRWLLGARPVAALRPR